MTRKPATKKASTPGKKPPAKSTKTRLPTREENEADPSGAGAEARAGSSPPPRGGGGKVKADLPTWTEVSPSEWKSSDGCRIKMLPNVGNKKNPRGFFVYHGTSYLGYEHSIEAAMDRANAKARTPRPYDDVRPDGMPAFLAITQEERDRARSQWTPPVPPETEEAKKAREIRASMQTGEHGRATGKRRPARPDGGEGGAASERRPRGSKKGEDISRGGVIRMLVSENPRKPGSGAAQRFDFLLKFDGKKVGEYADAGGNLETLANAVAASRAKVE